MQPRAEAEGSPQVGGDARENGRGDAASTAETSTPLDREFWALASLAAATARQRSPEEIARAALDVLVVATEAVAGVIFVLEGDRYDTVASVGISRETVDVVERTRLAGRMALAVADPASVVLTSRADAPFADEVNAALGRDGLEHFLFTGLWVASRLVGVIGLGWEEPPVAPPSEPTMLQAAALVAATVEHGRLDARLTRAFEAERRLTTGLQTLVRLTRLTAAARDEEAFAALALGEISRTLGADAGAILRVDREGLEQLATRNIPEAFAALGPRRPGDWMFMRRLRHGEGPFIEPFTVSSPDVEAVAERIGYQAYAVVPVRIDAHLQSVLVLMFARPKEELAVDERTLGAVERVLEVAFANQRLRRAVAAGERRYRSLFERSPIGIVVSAADGTIVDANVAAEEIYGFGAGEMLGRRMRELAADTPERIEERRALILATGGGVFETRERRTDGTMFPAEISTAGFEVDGAHQYVLIVRDLSERRRLEDELVQAQKMDAIGQLVAGVAHELNNPLASIIGFSQLIRDDPELPANLRDNAELLVGEADRTRRIVGNLLDFARRRPPERVPSSIAALVRTVVDLSAYSLRAARISVRTEIPSTLPAIPIDRAQLQQVLLNLTTNSIHAIRSTGEPGTLTFRARLLRAADDGPAYVRLSVSDTGPGVPPQHRDRVFTPFFTTKPPGEGTGLGLSVSAGIVASHGGHLSYEPRRSGGAVFHIDLPVSVPSAGGAPPPATRRGVTARPPAVAPEPTRRRRAAAGRRPSPAPAPPRGGRVVVVDDEPAIRTFLDKALRDGGFVPVVVGTGPEAVDAVAKEDAVAFLCDYRMAGMTGTEVFAAVTRLRPHLRDHFVFMSGDVLNAELHAFATEHGIPVLAKPFDLETVERLVEEVAAAP